MRYILFLAFALPLQAKLLNAQRASELVTGARVRVTPVEGKASVGFLSRITPDSLAMLREGGAVPQGAFALPDVRSVEVSSGKSGVKGFFYTGAKWSLITGAAGAVIGFATFKEPKNNCYICIGPQNRPDAALFGFAAGAIPAFIVGGIIGGIRGRDNWHNVPFR